MEVIFWLIVVIFLLLVGIFWVVARDATFGIKKDKYDVWNYDHSVGTISNGSRTESVFH